MSATLSTETAPDASTFDLVPPRRPGLPDVNNAELQNDGEEPPPDGSFPTAALLNTLSKLVVAYGKILPVALVTVNASTLQIVVTPSNTVLRSAFTVTPVTPGQVDVTWTQGILPIVGAAPTALVALNEQLGAHSYSASAKGFVLSGNHGVHVYTNQDTTPTYLAFALLIF